MIHQEIEGGLTNDNNRRICVQMLMMMLMLKMIWIPVCQMMMTMMMMMMMTMSFYQLDQLGLHTCGYLDDDHDDHDVSLYSQCCFCFQSCYWQ